MEHILGIKIVDIEFVEPQKVEKTGYEVKGVRFDLYVKDKAGVVCNEEPDLKFGDQSYKVVINTKGSRGDISDELKEAIKYLDDGTVTGNYSKELDDAVRAVKSSEERRVEYMLICARDNELIAKGDINRMKEDAKGMYEEGLSLDVIARIQKTTVDVVKKLLGLDQEPVAFG